MANTPNKPQNSAPIRPTANAPRQIRASENPPATPPRPVPNPPKQVPKSL